MKPKKSSTYPPDRLPVSNTAIVDYIPKSQPPVTVGYLIRADGYTMLIPAKVTPTMHAPLTAADAIRTNLWITYHGVPGNDGIVILDRADFYTNQVNHDESKLRAKHDYDPSSVDPKAKQSSLSKFLLGLDPKKFPPHEDVDMQSRIDRIGTSLIPAYQRDLLPDDITRIDFRFYIVDNKDLGSFFGLENGVVLVPYQIVQQLKNDSQVAALLANSIAEVLEKQSVHNVSVGRKTLLANLTGETVGALVPGVGLATIIATNRIGNHILTLEQQQGSRVSLCFMHDAGYNLEEAPEAWHILSAHPGKDVNGKKITPRADSLFIYLDAYWRISPPM